MAAALCLVTVLAGCGEPASTGSDSVAEGQLSPRRVVVLAPAAAEMLEALDLLDRVVGIGDFGPWPTAITDKPRVGGYSAPNLEQVLGLGSELVLTTSSEAAVASHRKLESLGVRVVALDTSTYEGLFHSLERIGSAFDRPARAAALADRLRGRLDALATRAANLPRRRVLFVVGRDPLFVAGPGSHIDQMISLVGGVNVARDALSSYPQVSLETILERMPEVIIDASDNRPAAPRGREVGSWSRWEFLPAVRERRVYWVEPGRLVIPGIRLPEMTELMGRLVHPEVFGEPSPEEMGPFTIDAQSP
jgi:iron complex transport system substrate-binding protein